MQTKITNLILQGVSTYKGVSLPSSQGSGTTTQKVSYATMKAKQFIINNPNLN